MTRPENFGVTRLDLPAPGEVVDVCWYDAGGVLRGTAEGGIREIRLTRRGYLALVFARPSYAGSRCPDLYAPDAFVTLSALLHAGLIGGDR